MSRLVRDKLAEVRSRLALVASVTGLSRAVLWGLAVLSAVMVTDFLIELPWVVRLAGLLAAAGGAGWIVWREAVSVYARPPSDDEVALWVERDQPALRQRVISTVQLTRRAGVVGHPGLVGRLVAETEELLAPVDLPARVPQERMLKWGGVAAGGSIVFVLALALAGGDGVSLLLRALCVPGVEVPRKTRLEFVDLPAVVARGDDVVITARARGVTPDDARFSVRWQRSGLQSYTTPRADFGDDVPAPGPVSLDQATDPAVAPRSDDAPATGPVSLEATAGPAADQRSDEYRLVLRGVTEGFTVRVYAGDGRSAEAEVKVAVRPLATDVRVLVVPPAYARMEKARRPVSDLVLLQGSRLEVAVGASKPVRATGAGGTLAGDGTGQNRLVFFGDSGVLRAFPLVSTPEGLAAREGAVGSVPVPPGTVGMAIVLVDDDGLETRDPAVHRVELLHDRAPTVRVTAPVRKEEVATRAAVVRVGFDVADDIGLASVRLRYVLRVPRASDVGNVGGVVGGAVEGGAATPDEAFGVADAEVRTVELDVPAGEKSFRGFHLWRLADLRPGGLPEGTLVEWWVEAADANDLTGPGRTSSERHLTRIGTEAQVRDALMARLNSSFGQLQDTRQAQQDLARDLGKLVTERAVTPATTPSR